MSTAHSSHAETWDVRIGRRVHHLMWDAHVTQTELARKVGLSQSTLGKKIRGELGWSPGLLVAIARALDTTVAYLFSETEDPRPPQRPGVLLPEEDSNFQPAG